MAVDQVYFIPILFSTADYYTFPKSIHKEKSLDVPKCLHFIYVGKAIKDNYVNNIRKETDSISINKFKFVKKG